VDNINLLTNLSIAALLIIVGYLIARQALPILDRIANAMTKHLAGIDTSLRDFKDTVEDIRAMIETEQRTRGQDTGFRTRHRRPPSDENEDNGG
jgi:hypothetical protein